MTTALPQGLTLATINAPPTADQWNTTELSVAQTLGLPTTSWEPGAVERVVFATVGNMMMQADVAASIAIQAGFLNFAAFGTVAWTDATGVSRTVYVTPDPSLPAQNPTGALGWLDVLADGAYNVQRILYASAGGVLAVLNTQATTYGPFAAGTYHVSQPGAPGAPGYTNTASLTIPQSATLGTVTATGTSGGKVKLTAAGAWTLGQVIFVAGVTGTTEANGAWQVTATDGSTYVTIGAVYSSAWVSGGTIYSPALIGAVADVAGTGSNAAPNTVTHPITSYVGVSVANYATWAGSNIEGNAALVTRCQAKLQSVTTNGPKGAYLYYALTSITLGPLLTPAVTISSAITRCLVIATSGTVNYYLANASGAVGSTDITNVDAVVQAYAVPAGVTAAPHSASALSVTVLCTIYVPLAQAGPAGTVVPVAVSAYFQTLPIGGVSDPSGPTNVLPIDGLMGAIFAACTSAGVTPQDLTLTLNGSATNVIMTATQVAVFLNSATFVAGTDLTVVGY